MVLTLKNNCKKFLMYLLKISYDVFYLTQQNLNLNSIYMWGRKKDKAMDCIIEIGGGVSRIEFRLGAWTM